MPRIARATDIDISCRQQFEYNVQAGYCIQNSIQTNLSQARQSAQPTTTMCAKTGQSREYGADRDVLCVDVFSICDDGACYVSRHVLGIGIMSPDVGRG